MTTQQLELFGPAPEAKFPPRPCAVMAVRCTTCALPQCQDAPQCSRCERQANMEVSSFSWFVNTEPGARRKAYVIHRWVLTCWWHSGGVTDELRTDVLALGPAYLIRWTAKPYGILAGGTSACADVEQVAA